MTEREFDCELPTEDDLCTAGIKTIKRHVEPEKVTDNTIMYFGKHEGERLKDISDSYFYYLYMYYDGLRTNYPKMYKYAKLVADNYEPEERYGGWCSWCSRPNDWCKCGD